MSTECERAARVKAGPTRNAGTPVARRNVLITRTTASSPAVGAATPTEERRSGGVMPLASARALPASAATSTSITTLRMRLFPVIRRSAAEVNAEIGYLQEERENFVQLASDNFQFREE